MQNYLIMMENIVENSSINLDKILVEEVGQFGKFQILTLVTVAIAALFDGMNTSEYIFTTGRLPTRCLIPECEESDSAEWEPAWLGNAVPDSAGKYDQCRRFANVTAVADMAPGTCPALLFDRDDLVLCEQYVHNRTNTVVYDFGLECNEWRRAFVGSARVIGTMVFLPINGMLSDRWGRRVVLVASSVARAFLGVLRAFVNSYECFVVLQALESAFLCYITGAVLVTEFMGPKFRTVAGPFLSCFAATGACISGLIAWALQDNWRHYTLIIFAPQFLTIGFFWFVPESVRWSMSKGKYRQVERVLQNAAKINNRTLSENTSRILKKGFVETPEKHRVSGDIWLPLQVLRSKVILYRSLVAPVWWISGIMVYYGLSINSTSLGGDQYVNYLAVSAIEIPGFVTAMYVLNKFGRKSTLLYAFFACSGCLFAFAFIDAGYHHVRLAVYLLGKYCISVVMTSVYVYTQEIFPTKCRQSLLAYCSMMGRIGGIIAPLTPVLMTYWVGIPSVLFGILTLLSAALIITTPETLGTKLPDTIQEAENIRKI